MPDKQHLLQSTSNKTVDRPLQPDGTSGDADSAIKGTRT